MSTIHHAPSKGCILVALCLGQMYIAKTKLSPSWTAAQLLDGTSAGGTRAQSAVSNDPKRWGFQDNTFSSVSTLFATASSGP